MVSTNYDRVTTVKKAPRRTQSDHLQDVRVDVCNAFWTVFLFL